MIIIIIIKNNSKFPALVIPVKNSKYDLHLLMQEEKKTQITVYNCYKKSHIFKAKFIWFRGGKEMPGRRLIPALPASSPCSAPLTAESWVCVCVLDAAGTQPTPCTSAAPIPKPRFGEARAEEGF